MEYIVDGKIVNTDDAAKTWEDSYTWLEGDDLVYNPGGQHPRSVHYDGICNHQRLHRFIIERRPRYLIEYTEIHMWDPGPHVGEWLSDYEVAVWLWKAGYDLPPEFKHYLRIIEGQERVFIPIEVLMRNLRVNEEGKFEKINPRGRFVIDRQDGELYNPDLDELREICGIKDKEKWVDLYKEEIEI